MRDREFYLRVYAITLLFASLVIVVGVLKQDSVIASSIIAGISYILGYTHKAYRSRKR